METPIVDFLAQERNTELREFNLFVVELNTIKRCLKYTNNNHTKAAKLLGVSRATLHRKMQRYRLIQKLAIKCKAVHRVVTSGGLPDETTGP
jgi:DNA-binding NtrC family response regulator